MSPIFSKYNRSNRLLANFKCLAQRCLSIFTSLIETSYFKNVSIFKFSGWIRLSRTRNIFSSGLSVLLSHIQEIISPSSKKQMLRANAQFIVTFMANAKIWISDFPVFKFIRNATSNKMNLLGELIGIRNTNLTISIPSCSPSPKPACFCFIHFSPESIFNGHWRYVT